jgi:hypothetical protein
MTNLFNLGVFMTCKKAILQAFNQFGKLTDYDLEQICGIDGNSIRPSRNALERAGVIARTGNRIMHPGKSNGYREYELVKEKEAMVVRIPKEKEAMVVSIPKEKEAILVRIPLNISGFLELVNNLRAGKSNIQLTDGIAVIDGNISIDMIKPHKVKIVNGESSPDFDEAVEPRRLEPRRLEQSQLFNYRILRPNAKKPCVTSRHYKARLAVGIHSKGDIKTFRIQSIPKMSQETKDDLVAIGIDTLGKLLGTSILGVKSKIVGKDGRVNENYMNGLLENIRCALDPMGFKFSRYHPHNENPDGTPRRQEQIS